VIAAWAMPAVGTGNKLVQYFPCLSKLFNFKKFFLNIKNPHQNLIEEWTL